MTGVQTCALPISADTGADYLCNIIYGIYGKEVYVIDVYYTDEPMEITEGETARRLYENNVNLAKIESNNGGRSFARRVREILAEKYSGKYMTFRFSPGYGDYPIEMQKEYLRILDAPRKIGLTTGDSCLLVPSKSVTAVLGISDNPIERRKRGCAICSMKGKCRFRRNGEHCGV